jgi:hypothetical protein
MSGAVASEYPFPDTMSTFHIGYAASCAAPRGALFLSFGFVMVHLGPARLAPRRRERLRAGSIVRLPLVRNSGVLMRASTISIALTLTLMPAPAVPFDQEEFCVAVTGVAQRMNARRGKWLDRSTRHDGVGVDCQSKTLEAKRFLNTDADAMREGWEERKQREWSAAYCNHESWREAIDNGWSIISTLTFRTGQQMSFVAEC